MTKETQPNAANRREAEDVARQATPGLVGLVLAGLWEAVILFRFRVLSRYLPANQTAIGQRSNFSSFANVEHPSTVQTSLFCHFYLIASSSAPH